MLDPKIDDKVRKSFARQSMMATLGAEMNALAEGTCEITAPILESARQQAGAAHAGLTFAIGDSAAGYAALTLFDPEADIVTVEMKINLLRPAIGERLIARGSVVKPGRRVSVVQAEVVALVDGTEKQVALLQGTMIPV